MTPDPSGVEPCWACEGRGSSIHTYGPNCALSETAQRGKSEPAGSAPIGPESSR